MAPPQALTGMAAKLRTSRAILLAVTNAMGQGSTPEEVLKYFIEVLKSVSPGLRLTITLLTPWALLGVALMKYRAIASVCLSVRKFVFSSFTNSVSIPRKHPLHKQILSWMFEQGLGRNARTLALVHHSSDSKHARYDPFLDMPGMRRKKLPKTDQDQDKEKRDHLNYVPDTGRYDFTFRGYSMTFEKQPHQDDAIDPLTKVPLVHHHNSETITISCRSLFPSTKPLQLLLDHIKQSAAAAEEAMTKIYRPEMGRDGAQWDEGIARPSRTMDAVTLDAHIKDPLVKDIEDYLDPRTRKFYISNSIPYRRGYLFYGPPGTGKTSFSCALAGQYSLNVYLLSLSDVAITDKTLESLFEQLPTKCIVLLEDIDSAGIKREEMRRPKRMKDSEDTSPGYLSIPGYDEYGQPTYDSTPPQRITLSALLNVLDGIHAVEGRITIMTSNTPDSLDKALIRPGRIDRKVLFGYASHEVCAKLFMRIFTKSTDQLLDGERPFEQDIPALAKAFADCVPEEKITPAEVLSHLLQNRTDPEAALGGAAAFARQIIEEKEKEEKESESESEDDSEDEDESDSADDEEDGTNDPFYFTSVSLPPPPPPHISSIMRKGRKRNRHAMLPPPPPPAKKSSKKKSSKSKKSRSEDHAADSATKTKHKKRKDKTSLPPAPPPPESSPSVSELSDSGASTPRSGASTRPGSAMSLNAPASTRASSISDGVPGDEDVKMKPKDELSGKVQEERDEVRSRPPTSGLENLETFYDEF